MPRYVVLSRDGQPRAEDLERISNEEGVTVVDDTTGRVLLIEASEAVVKRLRQHLTRWIVSEEMVLPRPNLPKLSIKSVDDGCDRD